MDIVKKIFRSLKPTYDDTVVDRLHYVYSSMVLAFFSIVIGAYQFGGSPVKCWTEKQFSGGWDQYVHDYCFVEGTYTVDHKKGDSFSQAVKDDNHLYYYQWVPFILAIQCVVFAIPHRLWISFRSAGAISLQSVVHRATYMKNTPSGRIKAAKAIAEHLVGSHEEQKDSLQTNRSSAQKIKGSFAKTCGYYMMCLYLYTKALNLLLVIAQWFFLNQFLGHEYHYWGYDILADIINGRTWQQSGTFPRVTFCDFKVAKMGNQKHEITVQCVLWINMLNEKVFIFIWWWLVIVAVITLIDFIYWCGVMMVKSCSTGFLRPYLVREKQHSTRYVQEFVRSYVKYDGILALRLISENAGDLVTSLVVKDLWNRFLSMKSGTGEDGFREDRPRKDTGSDVDESDHDDDTTTTVGSYDVNSPPGGAHHRSVDNLLETKESAF